MEGFLLKISSSIPLINLLNLTASGAIFLTLKSQMQYLNVSNSNRVGLFISLLIDPYQYVSSNVELLFRRIILFLFRN
jgi:hypothetical protein